MYTSKEVGAAPTAPVSTTHINVFNEAMSMNTVKFTVTTAVRSTYLEAVAIHGSNQAARLAANAARAVHTDWAWPRLAEAIANASATKTEAQRLMEEAWAELTAHANEVAFGYKAGLALAGPVAQRHAAIMDLSPIALPTGESGTWTAVHSLPQPRQVLHENPELVDRLRATARAVAVKEDLQAVWKAAPAYLQKEVLSRALDAKFAGPDQVAVINRHKVKAAAFRDLAALQAAGKPARVAKGAERAIQQALKLAFQWADSAAFWETAQRPRQPAIDQMDEDAYAGEEDWEHSTPITTHRVMGRTVGQRWNSRCELQELIAADYAAAAEDAEALADELAALLESTGYAVVWGYQRLDDGTFSEVSSKEEMLDILEERSAARAARRMAGDLGFEVQDQAGLQSAILAAFNDEERAALEALLEGGAV